MSSSFAPELIQRAEVSSEHHQPLPHFPEISKAPVKMVFCCFDPRVKPEEFLELTDADRAFLIRTASGSPARNIGDIVAIDTLLGVAEVIVIKHTDCGATHQTNDDVRNHILEYNPELVGKLDDFPLVAAPDISKQGQEDIELIKSSPYLRKELRDTASGLLYDIDTGKLTRIA
ncbi:carbonic anhydrase [Xylaria palmicola]|nr:carbonic anhydrase [Xylaria palmicola]